jgi:hypothetical protein
MPPSGMRQVDLVDFDRRVRAADSTRPILGGEVSRTAIGDAHAFLVDPHDPLRIEYERRLVGSREEGRPLMVAEVATLAKVTPSDARMLLERFGGDSIVGFSGLLLEGALFGSQELGVTWPSSSGPDGRPNAPLGSVADVVNWSDRSHPSVTKTPYGRLMEQILPQTLGVTAAPLAFVRSPELLVVGPPTCGGRGYALAAPTSGAGGVERATLLDPEGKGWLLLTEPGTYRVRLACDGDRATTVDAKGRRFTSEPGFGHLQEVRLDSTP